jgi:hypothetical protein
MKNTGESAITRVLALLCGVVLSVLAGSVTVNADVVSDWNTIAVDTAVANKANPFAQARYAAIVQLAVFEAVNAVTGEYQPYTGLVAPARGASANAAAIQAAYEVLSAYFPASQASLNAAYRSSMMSVTDGSNAKTAGMAAGHAAAQAMIALRANDGSSPAQFKVPSPLVPGEWQATPSCPLNANGIAVGIAFQWQHITPFGVPRASDFLLGPPPELTSEKYAKAYNEVMTVGSIGSTQRPGRAVLRGFFANAGVQSGRPAGRPATGAFALRKCTCLRADQYGNKRQPGRIVLQQVSLQFLATRNSNPRWRYRRQPKNHR